MKKRIIGVALLSLVFAVERAFSQNEGETKTTFSLKEAQDFAFKNNANMQNANLDAQIAVAQKNEIRGIGFPQINASIDFKDYLKIPVVLVPADGFGGPPGSFLEFEFGTQFNVTAGFEASQIIFSGDYIVALQASKAYLELSTKAVERTKIETSVSISKAYYNVLVNRERIKLLEANIVRLQKLRDETKAMNASGLVERVDADRVEVAYNNLLVEQENTIRLVALGELLLKFQMGMPVNTPITLTDSLDINAIQQTDLQPSKVDYNNKIDYSLVQTQLRLNELNLRKDKFGYLPSLVAYAGLNTALMGNELDLNGRWYPTALIGAKLSVPIFSGLQKNYKIQRSKLEVIKTQNTLGMIEKSIDLEVASAQANYQNSIKSLQIQDRNMELANSVFKDSKAKYDQGLGSNLELMTAETSLKEARTNYYNSLYNALVAKTDYEKAMGLIK